MTTQLLGAGPTLSIVSATALFTLSLVAFFGVHRWRATRRARRLTSRIGRPVPDGAALATAHGQSVVIEGTLRVRGGADAIVTFHPYGVAADEVSKHAKTAVDGEAIVELSGGEVHLALPLVVLSGSRETEPRGDARTAALRLRVPCPVAPGEPAAGGLSVLRSGDRVRVAGTLELVPEADSETTHEKPAATDDSHDTQASGGAAYRRPRMKRRLRGATRSDWPDAPLPIVLATPARFRPGGRVFAAALLAAAVGAIASGPARDAFLRAREARARIDRVACASARAPHFAANDPRGALALPSCHDPASAAEAHFLLGEFAAASDEWMSARAVDPTLTPSVSEVEAHSLAKRPLAARDVVRVMIERWYPGPGGEEKQALECIMHGFARAGGDPAGVSALDHAIKNWPHSLVCDVIAGDYGYRTLGVSGGNRRHEDEMSALFDAEGYGGSGSGEFHDPYAVVQAPGAWFRHRPLALEKSVLERAFRARAPNDIEWDHDKTDFGHHAAELAAFYAVMGDPPRALAHLDLVDAIALAEPPYPSNRADFPDDVAANDFRWQKVLAVAAGAAFEAGDDARAERYLPRAEAHSRAVIEHHLVLKRRPESDPRFGDPSWGTLWFPNVDVLAAAQRGGSAADAVRVLEETHTTARPVFGALLARVRGDRSALERWAKTKLPAPCATCGVDTVAESVSDRLAIARALGDRIATASLQAVADRYVTALLERDGAPERLELARLVDGIMKRKAP